MCTITLIGTGHTERGKCNSHELYKIIKRIAPDVIFEEVPPSKFAAIYKGAPIKSLEIKTIKRYLQQYPIAHFPVDLDTNELNMRFKTDFRELDDIFKDHSSEYDVLSSGLTFLSARLGFPYINSDLCRALLARKRFLQEIMLKKLNQEKFLEIYKTWLDIQDRREIEMLKNIYALIERHKYNRALFLIGTGHQESIIDKISKFEKNNKSELKWIFSPNGKLRH